MDDTPAGRRSGGRRTGRRARQSSDTRSQAGEGGGARRTRDLLDPGKVPHAADVAVGRDRDAVLGRDDDDVAQALHQRALGAAHRLCAGVDRQVADARLADAVDERERVGLVRQQADLARDGDRHGRDERRQDRAQQVGRREQARARAVVRREGLGAAAVEVDAGDVALDRQRGLDGQFRVGRADLLVESKDEKASKARGRGERATGVSSKCLRRWAGRERGEGGRGTHVDQLVLLDWVRPPLRLALLVVRDETRPFCRPGLQASSVRSAAVSWRGRRGTGEAWAGLN